MYKYTFNLAFFSKKAFREEWDHGGSKPTGGFWRQSNHGGRSRKPPRAESDGPPASERWSYPSRQRSTKIKTSQVLLSVGWGEMGEVGGGGLLSRPLDEVWHRVWFLFHPCVPARLYSLKIQVQLQFTDKSSTTPVFRSPNTASCFVFLVQITLTRLGRGVAIQSAGTSASSIRISSAHAKATFSSPAATPRDRH